MSRAKSADALPAGVGSRDNLKTEESFAQGDTCGDLVSINTGDAGNLAKGASLTPQSGAALVSGTVINLTDSNFTKAGKLKRGVKYAKPLTKTERDQNFNVNGLVGGKDYMGGRFRGNWQFSIGTPADGELDQIDPSGNVSVAVLMTQVQALTIGQTAYIVNNLPYAVPLEYGHSKQAPGGMVRITLARFQRIVDEAIRNNQV
ncbi:hypothetical protein [Pseudomonas sp. EL_65y_Pfl2_R96]|uniref:hypothetical protein n=1 Tax=Pseudomonas sp. EL_65y_Pfl2_R96 TaxID=3088699 RepID=UPI0030D889C1